MNDVIIVGAGIAGLVCAQQLQQLGLKVLLVEKSRGLGGRIATRRLLETCADHGVRYLEPQGDRTQQLIQVLHNAKLIQQWTEIEYEWNQTELCSLEHIQPEPIQPRYVAPAGMTAIAKFLATGLEIQRNRRAIGLTYTQQHWELTLENSSTDLTPLAAKAIVLAVPAPQAAMLLTRLANQGLPLPFLQQLESVKFTPCFSAIASYTTTAPSALSKLSWRAIRFPAHAVLSWAGLDSSKRREAQFPLVVVQSNAAFAQQHLDTADLQTVGYTLLQELGRATVSWLADPNSVQVHRWRYAFVEHPLAASSLKTATPAPLICCGDWCGGNQIEAAIESGLSAATQTSQLLNQDSHLSFAKLLETLLSASLF